LVKTYGSEPEIYINHLEIYRRLRNKYYSNDWEKVGISQYMRMVRIGVKIAFDQRRIR
jgi:hypothetical protein